MSGVSLSISVLGNRDLQEKFALVTGPDSAARLHDAMGVRVRERVRDHLRELAASKHTTADRLGTSEYSGHFEQAAQAVDKSLVTSDASAATLTINHPGLGRALHDVTITPTGGAKALTIPINALAYNCRAGQFDNLFVWKSKNTGKAFLAMRQPEKTATLLLMYLLVRSVTQKQDRTLLPSDDELETAAAFGAVNFFNADIKKIQGQ